jgi:ABC-type transport system involved in multi-copper enzyme maturation permease subunit
MELPLVQRELTRLGRRRSTYLLRLFGPLLCAVYMILTVLGTDGLAFLVPDPVLRSFSITPQAEANALAFAVVVFQAMIAFVGAPVLAAGTIADERQDRTLNLITIANMRPSGMIFAKFTSCWVPASLLLLSTLPMGTFAAFFGGVTLRGVVIGFAVFAAWTTGACALGVLVSAGAQRTRDALLRTFVIQALVLAGLVYINTRWWWGGTLALSPVVAANFADSSGTAPFYFWPAIAIPLILSLLLLPLGMLVLRRTEASRLEATDTRSQRKRYRLAPFITLAASLGRDTDRSRRSPLGAITLALVLAGVAMVPVFGWLVILGLVMFEVAGPMSRSRNSGAWDDLAASPAPDSRIALAVYFGQLRTVAIYLPALFMADTLTLLLYQLIFGEMPGTTLFEHLQALFTVYHGTKILAVFGTIKILQGLFVIAMGTLLGAIGGRPAAQAMRGIVLIAVFYSLLTVMARTAAEEVFQFNEVRDNREYLRYAYIAAWFYVIPYAIGIVGILAYLSRRIRTMMSDVEGASSPMVPKRLAKLGATPIRLPFARAAKR